MKIEIQCYGLTIGTDEAFQAMQDGRLDKLMDKISDFTAGVYQDPNGQYQMLIFRTTKEREKAYNEAHACGIQSAAYMLQSLTVESKYLRPVKTGGKA